MAQSTETVEESKPIHPAILRLAYDHERMRKALESGTLAREMARAVSEYETR